MVHTKALSSRVFIFILVLTFLTGCSGGGDAAPQEVPSQAEEPTVAAPVAEAAVPVEEATPAEAAPAPQEAAPVAPAPTAETVIQHTMLPSEPAFLESQIVPECDSGAVYKPGTKFVLRAGCDRWANNMIERPFIPGTDTFYPWLDITTARMGFQQDGWIYFEVELFDNPPADSSGVLAVEVDVDRDGRGDYLVVIPEANTYPAEWTTDGVQVWQDANKNIGGKNAAISDSAASGDGFETQLFDGGEGSDPDLAWVRKLTSFDPVYQVALKDAVLGGNVGFAWSIWTLGEGFDPQAFDLVDSYRDGELAAVDNTCVNTQGMKKVSLPNQCSVTQAETTKKKSGGCTKTALPSYCTQEGPGYCTWNQTTCEWEQWN